MKPKRTLIVLASLVLAAAAPIAAAQTTEPEEEPRPASLQTKEADPSRAGETVAPLDAWRAIKRQADTALRLDDDAEKIAALRAFADEHPDWYEIDEVLDALVETQLDQDDYDAERVAADASRLARANEGSYRHPLSTVNEVFLEHELPLAPALAAIDEGRRRLEGERENLAEIDDEKERERAAARLDYYTSYASLLEAEARLLAGAPDEALTALEAAAAEVEAFDRNYVLLDDQGRQRLRLASGMDDRRLLIEAMVHLRLGRREEAARAAGRMLGFFSRTRYQAWRAELESELDRKRDTLFTVTGAPQPAPDFTLERLDGTTVTLSEMRGKVVILAFWATWCGPCLKELPVLESFHEEHRDEGVELIAINIDRFETRPAVKPFLEEQNIDVPVAFEDEQQLTGYDYAAIPALYVIDREGKIAEARVGYDPELEDKLSGKILSIARGAETPGRELFSVQVAPDGYAALWQQPVTGSPYAMGVASGRDGDPGEIGVVLRSKLVRWSAGGEELGSTPQQGWWRALRAEDLDRSGDNEWILGGYRDVKVLDEKGEVYWEHGASEEVSLVGVRDLDGDGLSEIVCREGEKLMALRHVPERAWRTPAFDGPERARMTVEGEVLIQDDEGLHRVDAQGGIHETSMSVPGSLRYLAGTVTAKDGAELTVFEGLWDPTPLLEHDLNGDGVPEIIVPARSGLVAYDLEGNEVLRIEGRDVSFEAAAGDLDGKGGDELVLFVQQYGLVALGHSGGVVARR